MRRGSEESGSGQTKAVQRRPTSGRESGAVSRARPGPLCPVRRALVDAASRQRHGASTVGRPSAQTRIEMPIVHDDPGVLPQGNTGHLRGSAQRVGREPVGQGLPGPRPAWWRSLVHCCLQHARRRRSVRVFGDLRNGSGRRPCPALDRPHCEREGARRGAPTGSSRDAAPRRLRSSTTVSQPVSRSRRANAENTSRRREDPRT